MQQFQNYLQYSVENKEDYKKIAILFSSSELLCFTIEFILVLLTLKNLLSCVREISTRKAYFF